jgi:hypothetical protein
MNYLDNGGNLYIESVNIGYDYNTTTFFDYLGLTYVYDGDEQEVNSIEGGQETFSDGLKFRYFGGHSPHYSLDRLEANGSELLFSSEDEYGRLFLNEQDNYKVISSSILLGALASGDSLDLKPYLISEMVNHFLGYNPVTSLKENIANLFSVNNYPNPFNSETIIEYSINEPGYVKIDVFNSSGRLVKRLFDGELNSGNYSVIWNATDTKGNNAESGLYFYKISTGDFTKTKKMILLR